MAIATINMCGIVGGFAGTYWMGWMHDLAGGYAAGVGWLSVPWIISVICVVWVTRRPATRGEFQAGDLGDLLTAPEKSL